MNKTIVKADPGRQDVMITRTFDAPKELVFKAYTDSKLIEQWWGPKNTKTIVEKLEAKKGGIWRFIHQGKDEKGQPVEYAFNGVIHEVVPNERIIQTFEFEPLPGHVSMDTAVFEEQDGVTTVKTTSVFQSVEDRDGMIASGMEGGMNDSYERLDELLEKTQKGSKNF